MWWRTGRGGAAGGARWHESAMADDDCSGSGGCDGDDEDGGDAGDGLNDGGSSGEDLDAITPMAMAPGNRSPDVCYLVITGSVFFARL